MKPNAPYAADPVIAETSALRDRTIRKPRHSWQVGVRPYRLQPIALAPVLAGDTLKAAAVQARAYTDPLLSPLRGWHLEYWWFFVRIIDMRDGEAILARLIDETQAPWASEAANADLYHHHGINWMSRCLENIVPMYFRDFGESWNSVMEGGLPVVQAKSHGWLENYIATSALPADDVNAEDFENLWSKWSVLSRNRLTTATYEEFLRQQGVEPPPRLRQPELELKIPELLRHYRDWQFPVSTVDPLSGNASNAVSWAIADRIDRARRFTEPGFIVGLTCARPKEYLPRNTVPASAIRQPGSAAGALNTAKSWLPPVYANEPGESLRSFPASPAAQGPVQQDGAGFAYHLDHRDLFLHGDQYLGGNIGNGLVLGRRAANWKYIDEASISSMFSGGADGSFIRQEGQVSLQIASRVRKTTA